MRREAIEDAFEDGVIEFLLRVRGDALRAGVPPIDIYSRIQSRVEAACRQAESVPVWITKVLRGLNVTDVRKTTLDAGRMLAETSARQGERHHLNRVSRRLAYIMARVIERADEAREARK